MVQLIELVKLFAGNPFIWVPLLFIFITLLFIQKRFDFRKEKIEHFEKSSDFLKKVESFLSITETEIDMPRDKVSIFQIENGFFSYFGQKFSISEVKFLVQIKTNAFYFFENYPRVKKYLIFDEDKLSMKEKYSLITKRIWVGTYLIVYTVFLGVGLMIAYLLLSHTWNLSETIQISILMVSVFGTGITSMYEAEKILTASKIVERCKIN